MTDECDTGTDSCCSCSVEAMVSVDERGQMVLPKELREKANIQPGDKLALIGWEQDGEICCLGMVKADRLTSLVKQFLGPMMSEVTRST